MSVNETNKLSNELNRNNYYKDNPFNSLDDAVDENDINIEFEEEKKEKDVSNDFLILLRSMVDKLPAPLKDPIEGINPLIEKIKDKEFCYKFLYSMKNNPINQTPINKKIYNNILDYYGIKDLPKEDLTKEEVPNEELSMIEFKDGFVVAPPSPIVSIVAPQKGGATQKIKKKSKRKEKYYTIKRR